MHSRYKEVFTACSAQVVSKQVTEIRNNVLMIMSGEVEDNLQEKSVVSHSEMFNIVTSTTSKRRQVVEMVHNPGVSLGMVDPTTGRL